jgi:uncharacterized repeat protein (TIGR01451 family)
VQRRRCSIGDLGPGESVSAVVTVAVPPSQPAGTITNVVDVASPTPDPNPGRRTAQASVEVQLEADVSVVKTIATNPVVAGQTISYDIVVTNNGPSDAVNVTLVDPFPPGTAFVSGSAPPVTACEISAEDLPVVTCVLPRLPTGGSVSGELILGIPASATGTITNTAVVGSEALDPQDADNVSTATAPIVAADSAVDLVVTTSGPAELLAGDSFTYDISVANEGVHFDCSDSY